MTGLLAHDLRLTHARRADGALLLGSSVPLPDVLHDPLERLAFWAGVAPERPLLTFADAGGARQALGYADALDAARRLHGALAARGLAPGARVASLLPAGAPALVLRLACLAGGFVHIALPPFPFSAPGADGALRPDAEALLGNARPELIVLPDPGHPLHARPGMATFGALEAAEAPAPADHPARPGDWSAIYFTSGSTGDAKGVPITRAMISSNQEACAAMWPFLRDRPVMVDWLPWHHVFGGLDNLFKIIWHGGTMHVDTPPSATTTAASLRLMAEVQPSLHIGVPLGLRLLLDAFDADPGLAAQCTARLRAIFFAGAGIDGALWQRLQAFQAREAAAGRSFAILSGYGATEAASTISLSARPLHAPGELGIPLPGHQVALVERDGRTEICVSGPNIAPSYLIDGAEAPLPTDDFGFYRTGDAGLLRARPDGAETLAFDGRLAEDFKLSSGVKVRTGPLRAGLIAACAPLARDIVIGGEGGERLVALVFADGGVAPEISARLASWNAANRGSSTAIARFALARIAADPAKGEVSAKGQIVQSRFLRNHAALFAALQRGETGQVPGA